MRVLIFVLYVLLCWSTAYSAERCFDEYAAEKDRSGLTYQSVNRQRNIARELTFQSDGGLLSVLVFNQKISNEEVLKIFDLLLKAKYEASELAQVNPKRLAETFNFAQKLVFPSSSETGSYETYLLFSEGGCQLIFRQESWSKGEIKFELDKLIATARLFSVMQPY